MKIRFEFIAYQVTKSLSILALLLLFSCSQRNLTYLSDLDEGGLNEDITNSVEATIQPYDLLDIEIISLSPESNVLFSNGVIQTGANAQNAVATSGAKGYLVDKDGFVAFPIIGKVKMAGLSKEEATVQLTEKLGKYARDPIVNIRFQNFKVTVIGEVNRPSTFTVPAEKITILEALGLAGDMTNHGRRENVLIIREQNGTRSTTRLDLNKKDVLNSPYFYLQQNDVVYVEADKAKTAETNPGRRNVQYWLAITSVLTLIITRLI